MSVSRILITGARGFIGRFLVQLCHEHHETFALDRLSSDLDVTGGVHWLNCDLTQPLTYESLPANVDTVIHLAQSLQYRDFPQGAEDMFQVNVMATYKLAEWARQHRVKRFIFASTGNVYKPAMTMKKLTEEDECGPVSMYAATKLSAEYLLHPYAAFFQVVITRLFGVYGPQQHQMLIANMIQRVQRREEITLAGGAGIYLTPIFVDDCVRVLEYLAVNPLENPVNILNVAGDQVLSLAEIVNEIAHQLHEQPVVKATDEQPRYFCGDNARLKRCYDSFTPFDKGLALTLQDAAGFALASGVA